MEKQAGKQRKLPRKGLLAGSSRTLRLTTAGVLAVACAALAFTQLGFAGIGFSGQYEAYAVILLIPIALAALLLGALWGAVIGAFAGAVQLWHAIAMPLNYYEMSFVTPLTSVLLLGVCGWLLGLMFSFALRNNPGPVKRAVYIIIVCSIVSLLFSLGFFVHVIISLIFDLANTVKSTGITDVEGSEMDALAASSVATMALRLGDMHLQFLVDALLMAVFCFAADVTVRKAGRYAGNMGLRGMFAAWLLVVVAAAFMISAGAGFASITQGEIVDASDNMESEANYLCTQLSEADSRGAALIELLDQEHVDLSAMSEDSWGNLIKSISSSTLLEGYTKENDGFIFVLYPDYGEADEITLEPSERRIIWLSDDEAFEEGKYLDEIVDAEVIGAIDKSLETGIVCRAVYDEVLIRTTDDLAKAGDTINSEIVYLFAQESDSGHTVVVMQPATMVFSDRDSVMRWLSISAFVLLAAVFGMVFLLLSRVVVNRIDETNDVLERITEGDLEARVDERETREFSSLSDGINTTVDALKGWIAEAETRMDAELATAKAIQESALPRTFPPYPDIQRFDVYASMKPAREVGGDFYDFFLIGGDCDGRAGKLGFVIADVSGKGVPAALFMMKAMTHIRDYLQSGTAVGEAVENANRKLCEGNDAGMFVTAWVGVLDYATGHVDFANAGHNPPLLWQRGAWRWLTEKSGLPLGLFEGFPYEAYSVECAIGDEFLLYTDGVTEAMSVDGELYGEERLMALADANFTLHPRRLVETVRRDVARHAAGAEQSDDITMLALEVGVPPEVTAILVVPADVAELPHVNEFVHAELDRRLCPKRVQNQLDIAVEELFVNVAHYAYPDATPDNPGMARVSYTYSAEPPSIEVVIADEGVPYNPLAKPDAVTPDDIMDVPIGGLGILMAKRSVDKMSYERVDDSNMVTILKKW